MSNTGRAQDYLMQIVSAGYGFDVPEIQNALMKTNYKSVEAAVEYLFGNQQQSNPNNKNNKNQAKSKSNGTSVSEKDMKDLKERIIKLELDGNFKMDVSTDIMNKAIQQNKNTEAALNYIMDTYTHLIKPNEDVEINNKQDVEQYKQKLIDDALEKKAQQEKDARDREKKFEIDKDNALREEKEKEKARQKHRERVALNKQKILNKKNKRKKTAQKATLEWHKRHEEYDKNDILRLQQIENNRVKQMKCIDSPEKALQTLFERYGEADARATITMMTKIINNILKHPQQEKYRKLNLQNNKIKERIVTPLGALKFFDFLGFEELIEKDKIFPTDVLKNKKFLIYKRVNENDLHQAILMLNKYNEITKTIIYDYVNKIKENESKENEKMSMNNDELYMALMHLYRIINNILISPNAQHLRMIFVDNDLFKKRVGKFQIFQKLLKQLGYKLEDRVKGRVFILSLNENSKEREAQLLYFKNVTRDLYSIAHDEILMSTTIGIGIKKIYHHNTTNVTDLYKYFNILIKAVEKILAEPLNMKYQSINIEKLQIKFTNITGIISVLKLLGFRKNKKDKTKFVLSAQYNGDLDLLKWRKTIFQNVINDKKLLKKN